MLNNWQSACNGTVDSQGQEWGVGWLHLMKLGVHMDLSDFKKKMLILHAKILKGAWRLTALVCFSRWQMPFCVLHKLTKFACSLYLFQRQPFFAFNGTEELLGTGSLLVWWGRKEGLFWGHSGTINTFHAQAEEGAGAAAFDSRYVRTVRLWANHRR